MILKIFKNDLKKLFKNVIAIVICIGISIIPALYAWFNIAACWDPYGSTGGIQVAVANEDAAYKVQDLSINAGKEVIDKLKGNKAIGWQFVSSKNAKAGVKDGKYYAAIIIPQSFSKNMCSLVSDKVENPELHYYVNEKKNAIAPKITDKGVSAIQLQVNESFVGVVSDTMTKVINETMGVMSQDGTAPLQNLINHFKTVRNNLATFKTTIDSFYNTTQSLKSLIKTTKYTLPDVNPLIQSGLVSTKNIENIMSSSKQTSQTISSMITNILSTGNSLLDTVEVNLTNLNKVIEADANNGANILDHLKQPVQAVINVNNQVLDVLTTIKTNSPTSISGIDTLINMVKSNNAALQTLQTQLTNAANTIRSSSTVPQDLLNKVKSQMTFIKNNISSLTTHYNNSVKPSIDGVYNNTFNALSSLSVFLSSYNGSYTHINQIFDGSVDSLDSGGKALNESGQAIQSTMNNLDTIISNVESVSQDKQVKKFLDLLQSDPSIASDFVSSPVKIKTTSLFSIENYGSAMAPFYSTLAIWVGGIVLVAILKTNVNDEEFASAKPYQRYFGRYLLFMSIGLIQSLVIALGDLLILKIQCPEPTLYILGCLLTSIVYTNIIYTLTITFGDIGKALCVIILVIQVAGSGGTFPMEVLPDFFRNINPFLPFTHSINMLRECVAGMYGYDYLIYLGYSFLYLPFSLFLGLWLRKPLIGINHFFEEKAGETGFM